MFTSADITTSTNIPGSERLFLSPNSSPENSESEEEKVNPKFEKLSEMCKNENYNWSEIESVFRQMNKEELHEFIVKFLDKNPSTSLPPGIDATLHKILKSFYQKIPAQSSEEVLGSQTVKMRETFGDYSQKKLEGKTLNFSNRSQRKTNNPYYGSGKKPTPRPDQDLIPNITEKV